MRKIKFKKWIPIDYYPSGIPKPDTACWENDFTGHGLFHQWVTIKDLGENQEIYIAALVELEDGTIEQMSYSRVKFIKEE